MRIVRVTAAASPTVSPAVVSKTPITASVPPTPPGMSEIAPTRLEKVKMKIACSIVKSETNETAHIYNARQTMIQPAQLSKRLKKNGIGLNKSDVLFTS